ncbi:nucleotide-binding universal stress UspA family protein [Jatrophihabitans sp. GAS493]|uniref:universal stress protein n=1 Tax=Jatrophihabitans sp. GAS493 TaxID=1907575 RepID=UPI000BB9229B|nr:universal stress protein [Jatrophihabitans sp. GAS493]SOD73628.1 nucleotide-binding universal stress UspA family protein [Jatrophihabitans sp. GAS493]
MEQSEVVAAREVIVVGVDGSEPSKQALRWAEFLAHATGSTIEAVIVWGRPYGYGMGSLGWGALPEGWDPAMDADKVLQETIDQVFGTQRPAGLTTASVQGGEAQQLLQLSRGCRMLIVGSRGHGGFAGLLLGSVSSACAEHSNCPVLVVHGDMPVPMPAPGANGSGDH